MLLVEKKARSGICEVSGHSANQLQEFEKSTSSREKQNGLRNGEQYGNGKKDNLFSRQQVKRDCKTCRVKEIAKHSGSQGKQVQKRKPEADSKQRRDKNPCPTQKNRLTRV